MCQQAQVVIRNIARLEDDLMSSELSLLNDRRRTTQNRLLDE